MRRAENLLRRADRWVFAPEDARRLAAMRIGLCVVLALRLGIVDYGVAARGPAVFEPHFYMDVFQRMPSPELVAALQICGVVAALMAASGLALNLSLPLALVCSLVLHGILNSTGRIVVGDALLTLSVLLLVVSGAAAGDAWSVREPLRRALRRLRARPLPETSIAPARPATSERYGWPIRTAMIAVALAYFFAGIQKWRYSGLPWVTSDNLRWILYGQTHPNDLALFVADRDWLSHFFAAGALLLETCFPLVLFVRRLRWVFIPAAVAMHIGIRLTLGLDYSAQWLTLVIVFGDWPVVVSWLRRTVALDLARRQLAG